MQERETNLTAEQLVAQASAQTARMIMMPLLSHYLAASELFLTEEKPHKALWLTKQLTVLMHSPSTAIPLSIIEAKSFLALEKIAEAYLALEQSNTIKEQAELSHSVDYFKTLAKCKPRENSPLLHSMLTYERST